MVRRVNVLLSGWLLWAVVCLMVCGVSASAQSPDVSRLHSTAGPDFIVAPSFRLASIPTSVAVGDINGDGRPDLMITKRGSGSVTVLLGDGRGGFGAGVEYAAGTQPGHVLLADIKGDGRLDAVVTDNATGSVNVLFGNGDGTFGKPVAYTAIARPVAIAVGNFSGSGKRDIAVAGPTGLAVLLNDGSGHFAAPLSISLDRAPSSLTSADLRGAGHDDLVVAHQDGTMRVLLGDGSGKFRAAPLSTIGSSALSSVVSGDFNHDGKADLAVAHAGSALLTVLLGRGDGSFQPGVNYAVGNGPVHVIVADLRGDGTSDLITLNQAANTFSVLLGNGDGSFKAAADFVAGNLPVGAVAGNFNGTVHPDLAILNAADGSISVPRGRGDGTFQAAQSYKAGLDRKSVAAGDVDGDGRADLVVTNFCGSDTTCKGNGNVTVFLANADGTYRQGATYALGVGPVAVALADLRGSNKLDLVALNRGDKTLTVMAGNGDGTFGQAQTYSLSGSPSALFVGDLDGDARPDVAIASDCGSSACAQPGSLTLWHGLGDGSLAESVSYAVGYSPVSIAAGDLHGTGHADLIVANACGGDSSCKSPGTATLFAGNGKGKFIQSGEISIGSSPSSIALGKLTGSGLDLVVAQRGSNQIAVLHGDGKGGFGAPVNYSVGSAPSALAIADLNGTGRQDVAVANFQGSTVSVLYGTVGGTLQPAVSYTVGTGPEALAAIIGGKNGTASVVTANGNSGAPQAGTDITVMAKPRPYAGVTANTTTLTATPSASSVNPASAVTLAVTVSGGAGTPTGTVNITGNGLPASVCAGLVLDGTGAASCTTSALQASTTTLTATYLGDTTYAVTTGTANVVISKLSPTITMTPAPSPASPSPLNTSVTFRATLAGVTFAPTAPGGTVSFSAGGNAIAGCTVAGVSATQVATCTTASLAAGATSITAVYSGDTNYNTATSAPLLYTITKVNTTTTVASLPAAPTVDQTATLTATVAGVSAIPAGGVALAGSVGFTNGGVAIPGCTAVAVVFTAGTGQGTASCPLSGLAAGTHNIVATYSGDTDYNTSASATLPLAVAKAATTTTVTSSPASPAAGSTVALTATVAPSVVPAPLPANTTAISGSVGFTDGGTAIAGCTAQAVTYSAVTGDASATCSLVSAAGGAHNIVATYTGDTNYGGSTSATATVSVAKAATTLTLAQNAATSNVNQLATFTVLVNPPAGVVLPIPSGTLSYTDNGTPIANCSPATLTSAGTFTCGTSLLSGGSHSIIAAYSGDANYNTSNNFVTHTVNPIASTTTLASTPSNSTTVNQAVTLTASVTPIAGPVLLSGTVTISDGGGPVAGCAVAFNAATGKATCTTSSLSVGSHALVAVYAGDPSYNTSTSSPDNQTVTKGSATVALASSQPTSAVNASVTFTATVTANPAGGVALSGSVGFNDSVTGAAIPNCSAVALTAGAAQCTTSSLTLGTHTITATYGSDANFTFTAGGNTVTQTVSSASTSTVIATSASPSTVNQTVAFTATVTAPSGGTALSGTVAFTDNNVAIAGCTALHPSGAGLAICSDLVLTAAGSPHTIVATYSNDSNFSGSAGTLLQTVNPATTSLVLGSSSPITGGTPTSAFGQAVTFTATITPSPTGNVALSGTVTFTDSVAPGTPLCTGVHPAANGVATCTTSSLAFGSHTITAAYGSDGNFGASNSTVTQTVGQSSSTITIASSANPSSVNAPVTFTGTVSLGGSTNFTGQVSFTVNGVAIAGCPALAPSAAGIATCTTSALPAPSNTIVAAYGNDTSFAGSSKTLTQVVNPVASTLALTATPTTGITAVNPAGANLRGSTSVLLSAQVAPTVAPGAIAVPYTGFVTFLDNGSPVPECLASIAVNPATGIAQCTTTSLFPGSNTIVASYSGDTSYLPTNQSEVLAVKDYALNVSSAPPVTVTEGFKTNTDLFSPQTITLTPVSISGFATAAGGDLALNCNNTGGQTNITVVAAAAGAVLPTCAPTSTALTVLASGVQQTVGIVIDATGASPGTYSVKVTGTDPTTNIVHVTAAFNVTVRAKSNFSGNLTSGSTTGNSGTVSFILPANVGITGFTCPLISGTGINSTTGVASSSLSVGCSFNPTSVAATASTQFPQVTVNVFTDGTHLTAGLASHTSLYLAGLLGIPIFGLIGLLRGRKSPGSAIFRLVAIFAICAAAFQVLGCGGSFKKPTTTGGGGKTPPGVYYLLIQGAAGKDASGNPITYDAVLQVNITL